MVFYNEDTKREEGPVFLKINPLSIVVSGMLVVSFATTLPACSHAAETATVSNFANPDVLEGHDGLPPSPLSPYRYGPPAITLDDMGNALEEHAATLSFFDGRYYMYAEKWACGKVVTSGKVNAATVAHSGGQCGLAAYSSSDLMHWHPESISNPAGVEGNPSKPHVLWSAPLQKYVLWFKAGSNFAPTGGLYYALADSPKGPWTQAHVAQGDHLGHDFDIALAQDGSAWIASDPFSGQYDPHSKGKPLWDVWVQKLRPDLTGTSDVPGTQKQVMKAADFEALGFFEHDGRWYLTGGPTCGNCAVPISYVSAKMPTGDWMNEQDESGDALRTGTVIAPDGCTGQNKGAMVLPSSGGPIVMTAVWGYRTNPHSRVANGHVVHGDNSQALSSTYWFPLSFDGQKHIRPLACQAQVRIPLAGMAGAVSVPSTKQADCRIRTQTVLEQDWGNAGPKGHSFAVPVFQKVDDGLLATSGGTALDGALDLEARFTDGTVIHRAFGADQVAWSPDSIRFSVPGEGVKTLSRLTFSTQATNGCYGVLAQPAVGHGRYSTLSSGEVHLAPQAEMVVLSR